jgi:hypothetical protein
MRIIVPYILLSFLASAFLLPPPDCSKYKKGVFHLYAQTGNYTLIRNDSLQIEVDKDAGDSSFWKIHWSSDCKYSLIFISGQRKVSGLQADMLQKTLVKISIVKATPDYYIYNAEAIYRGNTFPSSDTIWVRERLPFRSDI